MSSRSAAIFVALGVLGCATASSVLGAAPTTMPSGSTGEMALPAFDVDLEPPQTLRAVSAPAAPEDAPGATAPLPSAVPTGMVTMAFAGWMTWRIRRRGGRI